MSKSMQQWQYGPEGRASLALAQAPVPVAKRGEALVKVKAVSLNYRELLVLDDGDYDPAAGIKVLGSDMAGEVVALGEDVTRVAVGDRVMGNFGGGWIDGPSPQRAPTLGGALPGVLAEYVVMPAEWLVEAPASLDDAEASTLPIAALTAWTALVENGGLRPGQSLLVQGTGGVAIFAVQIAAAMGAEVIVTSSDAGKLDRAKALGATHGINRRDLPDWEAAVRDLTGGRGVDHVLDLVGGDNLARSIQAAAQGGQISLIGVIDGFSATLPLFEAIQRQVSLQGVMVGHRRSFENLVRAIDHIVLKPVIDSRFAFDDVPAALDRLKQGAFGKIVVRVA
jgi:NADPH:quinone reductase-like Zn-dependent oxidoreductase